MASVEGLCRSRQLTEVGACKRTVTECDIDLDRLLAAMLAMGRGQRGECRARLGTETRNGREEMFHGVSGISFEGRRQLLSQSGHARHDFWHRLCRSGIPSLSS